MFCRKKMECKCRLNNCIFGRERKESIKKRRQTQRKKERKGGGKAEQETETMIITIVKLNFQWIVRCHCVLAGLYVCAYKADRTDITWSALLGLYPIVLLLRIKYTVNL